MNTKKNRQILIIAYNITRYKASIYRSLDYGGYYTYTYNIYLMKTINVNIINTINT